MMDSWLWLTVKSEDVPLKLNCFCPLVQIDGNPAQFLIDAECESLLGNRPLMYTRYCDFTSKACTVFDDFDIGKPKPGPESYGC